MIIQPHSWTYIWRKLYSERYTHPSVHSSPVYGSQDMEATIMSVDRWRDKENVVCIHSVILLSHKKEWNNAIFSNMDGPRDYHTKWSKSDKDKYHIISLMCRIERNDTNELIYTTKKDSQTWKKKLWLPQGKGIREGWIRRLGLEDKNCYI